MRFALLCLWVVCICAARPQTEAADHNVLFIAVDDLRVELACYGSRQVKTPHIDRLAARGTQFNHAYCQQTVCNPSRASLLTGLRPDTLRVWDLPTHFRDNRPNTVTLPQTFKSHGYHTQCVGKIFHNWRQDNWKGDPLSWSVPSVLHYNSHYNDLAKVAGELPPDMASGRGKRKYVVCRDVPDNAYFDGRVAEAAIKTLREIKQSGSPFFLAVGFWKPHLPFNAPLKYWDMYDRQAIAVPEHLEPPSDVPEIALTESRLGGRDDPEMLRELHHGHLAAISYLDAQVGRVLEELDRLGFRDDTIVVFWSDHGLHVGEHGLIRKTTCFELDAGVPMIIASPRHAGGKKCDAIVELLDIYPTLTALCDLPTPEDLEGVSLLPLLEDPSGRVKPVALTQITRPAYYKSELPEVMGYSIRSPRYRYTEWRDFESGHVVARELYDHQHDPLETANVVDRSEHSAALKILAQQMQRSLAN